MQGKRAGLMTWIWLMEIQHLPGKLSLPSRTCSRKMEKWMHSGVESWKNRLMGRCSSFVWFSCLLSAHTIKLVFDNVVLSVYSSVFYCCKQSNLQKHHSMAPLRGQCNSSNIIQDWFPSMRSVYFSAFLVNTATGMGKD